MNYEHGGNIYKYKNSEQIIDFSANINPYGIPETVKKAMYNAIELCVHYPDASACELRRELSKAYNINPDLFFCGNGAAEIFYRFSLVLKPQKALITAPTFSEYEKSLLNVNCDIGYYILKEENNFNIQKDFIYNLTDDLDLCILCNPNNPTGCIISPEFMKEIIDVCKEKNIKLLVDECFIDFLVDEYKYSVIKFVSDNPHVTVVRAFTKMFAVAGVRLGWCVSSDINLINGLYKAGQPWNTSVIAQHCGIEALKLKDFPKQTAKNIKLLREKLENQLKSCGFKVFSGYANYILFHTSDCKLHEKLETKNILIRNCDNYRGLGRGFYRVAVKSEQHNLKLINAIKEVI